MLEGYFISGTDTNVGKTIVSAILVNKFRCIYYKPIQCGFDENGNKDSDVIKNICKNKIIFKETYILKNPLSPNIAAKKEKKKILLSSFKKLVNKKLDNKVIVEGAGGLCVPINNHLLTTDIIKIFKLPLILVCRTSLGTINHTLLSLNILRQQKIKLKGLVFVGKKEPETIRTILNFGKKIFKKKLDILAHIPHKKQINKSTIDKMKNLFTTL